MKRGVFLFLFLFVAFIVKAQGIYTKVTKYDKFDDVVSSIDIKTLINKNESKITIETKGQKQEEYIYYNDNYLSTHIGRRDSLSNLVENIYGFEDQYYIFPKDTVDQVLNDVLELSRKNGLPDSLMTYDLMKGLVKLSLVAKLVYAPTITFRTISKYEHLFEYETDLVWIRFKDGSRIIYSKR